jgi:hypothetical protein
MRKGEADQYFIDAGVPTTFLLASFYWENMIYFGAGPKRGEDGVLAITFPMGDKKLSGIGRLILANVLMVFLKEALNLLEKELE